VPIILPFPSNIGIIARVAPRRLGCIAFRLTAVAAVAANLDLEATASSSDVVLLCCSQLAERHGRWDELACGGGGLIRPGAAVLTSRSDGSISSEFVACGGALCCSVQRHRGEGKRRDVPASCAWMRTGRLRSLGALGRARLLARGARVVGLAGALSVLDRCRSDGSYLVCVCSL